MHGEPGPRASLVAALTDTLDVLINQQLVGVALFGEAGPAVGRYTIERRLGAGATAVVYAAQDTLLERPVALKVLAARDLDGAWRERAHREARALARLSHPNVVAIHDVGEWQGHPFLAMELVRGETLAMWQSGGRRAWREVLRHYLAAGRGLAAAHEIGLVHRDFKPANVLLAESGRVVVSDFGLVARIEPRVELAAGDPTGAADGRARAQVVGTPAYLAPEQLAGATPEPCADVYSFSVSLCEALLGRHPLLEPGLAWQRALASAGVPGAVRRALARGLEADAAQRWPSLTPILAALEATLRPRARARRVALGLLLVAGVAGLLMRANESAPPAPRALLASASASAATDPASPPFVSIARGLLGSDPTAAAALLRETPANRRGEDWADVARATLLRPIATEMACQPPGHYRSSSVDHGLLATVDAEGRAAVCELASARVLPLPLAATCVRVLDARRVAVFTDDGALVVLEKGDSWREQLRVDAGRDEPGASAGPSRCERDLSSAGPELLVLRLHDGRRQLVGLAAVVPPVLPAGAQGRHWVAVSRDGSRGLWRDTRRNLGVARSESATSTARPTPVLVASPALLAHDDDVTVAVAVRGTAGTVVDVRTGAVRQRRRLALLEGAYGLLAVAPHGRMAVVATSRGELMWWPLDGASEPTRVESVTEGNIMQVAFDARGEWLVWRDARGAIGVREVGSSRGHALASHQPSLCQVGFAGSDLVLAVGCDGRVTGWHLGDQRSIQVGAHDLAHCRPHCDGSERAIWSATPNQDGSLLATAGSDGTVGLWPTGAAPPRAPGLRLWIGAQRHAYTTRFDGQRVFVGARDGVAQIWDSRSGKRLAERAGHETWVYTLAIARPSGGPAIVVTGSKEAVLRFWDAGTFRWRATTRFEPKRRLVRVNDVAASADGRLVAAGLDSGEIVICDVLSARVVARVMAHRGWARRVMFLDDGTLLSAGDDGYVRAMSPATGTITAAMHADDAPIYDLDVLGGRLLTASGTGTVRLWDLATGRLIRSYIGHEQLVSSVRWHASGAWFVSASRDGRACLWSVDRSTCHSWLVGHTDEVRSAHFIDRERLVTTSFDGTVRVWSPFWDATIETLAAQLARRAPACLSEQQRVTYLGESAADAGVRAHACKSR